VRKRSATKRQQQQDVGHEGVITGRDAFSLRSSIADPEGVTQSPLQSTYLYSIRFNKLYFLFSGMNLVSIMENAVGVLVI
ncbi:hypothetical protein, partial [Lysinibacillus xylanilyticus]|uniref:hypothetical protein n=1 Tax=Lysinibacillus xylanilyticus TaxID=582475 RepID=UPI003D02FEFA